MDLSKLEKLIQYEFKNKELLKEALTHRSYLNENPRWHAPNNERLEFLGDAVLELATTEALFGKFPNEDEGKLTTYRAALVNYQMLAKLSAEIKLGDFLLMSKGEAKDQGRAREVILANAMEALIGALYLDGGYQETQRFISRIVLPALEDVLSKKLYRDPKSLLQEKSQAEYKSTPIYKLLGESGPDHKKVFVVGVFIRDEKVAEGKGMSKQDAEVEAARKALEIVEE